MADTKVVFRICLAVVVLTALVAVSRASPSGRTSTLLAESPLAESPLASAPGNTTQIYLANGCFWERQWAYYVVETTEASFGPRAAADFSAKVGYAGGTAHPQVCYHSGDDRDYSTLGHLEAVRVVLDAPTATQQMAALARDFFNSFTGPAGERARPDPGDIGSAYRSAIGLPGGMRSPLYATFAAANTWKMTLKAGHGSDADEFNTVWVYDSDALPFYDGERYHQAHCNFFMSEGMPYPSAYTSSLWSRRALDGGKYGNVWAPTGCPEGVMPHPGQLCDAPSWQVEIG